MPGFSDVLGHEQTIAQDVYKRQGGDCIGSDLVPLSTGYDFMEMIVDVACGKAPKIVPKTCLLYTSRWLPLHPV